jgi:hypothetical protein
MLYGEESASEDQEAVRPREGATTSAWGGNVFARKIGRRSKVSTVRRAVVEGLLAAQLIAVIRSTAIA